MTNQHFQQSLLQVHNHKQRGQRDLEDHSWGYEEQDGPQIWPQMFDTGQSQSPINILVGSSSSSTCCAGQPLDKLARSLSEALPSSAKKSCLARKYLQGHKDHQSSHKRSSSVNSSSGSSSSTSDDPFEENTDSCSNFSTNSSSVDLDSSLRDNHKHRLRLACQTARQETRLIVNRHKLFLGYPRYLNSMQLSNTGHGWEVSLPVELSQHTLLSGPPFGDREYRLLQFHCHWGSDCNHGSEHQINGKNFSAELHFVHWNCTDFSSPSEASKHKHGLAVLGVLIQALDGEQNRNKHLDKIAHAIDKIQKPGSRVSIGARLDIKKLFPADRWHYATYEGSLTTPPLSEVVDWLLFLQPIQCSTSQIERFRKLKCRSDREPNLISNCRPVQPTNGRLVTLWSHH